MGEGKPTGTAERARRWLVTGAWVAVIAGFLAVAAGIESANQEARRLSSAKWLGLFAVAAGFAAAGGAWLAVQGWKRGGAKGLAIMAPVRDRVPATTPPTPMPAWLSGWRLPVLAAVGVGLLVYSRSGDGLTPKQRALEREADEWSEKHVVYPYQMQEYIEFCDRYKRAFGRNWDDPPAKKKASP